MFQTDLWVAAFVRRHNDLGHICVITQRGDPIAGQIFIELDHLDGTISLYTPAPATARADNDPDRIFVVAYEHVEPTKVRDRLVREQRFDSDLWVIALEMRDADPGVTLARS